MCKWCKFYIFKILLVELSLWDIMERMDIKYQMLKDLKSTTFQEVKEVECTKANRLKTSFQATHSYGSSVTHQQSLEVFCIYVVGCSGLHTLVFCVYSMTL